MKNKSLLGLAPGRRALKTTKSKQTTHVRSCVSRELATFLTRIVYD